MAAFYDHVLWLRFNERAFADLLISQQIREQTRSGTVQPDMKRDGRTVSRAALEEMRLVAYVWLR